MADDLLDIRLRMKMRLYLCKLDIEKAYHHFKWEFQLDIMDSIGFSSGSEDAHVLANIQ